MEKRYQKPIIKDLGKSIDHSYGQVLCAAGSTDTGLCSNGDAAGSGCSNGNWNRSGLGCDNGNNNAGDPAYGCINGNNNETGACNTGSNVIPSP